MPTYAIGDIHGCYSSLLALLNKIRFDPVIDKILLTGDLINRGPRSSYVLDFAIKHQHCITTILGNHDIALLIFMSDLENIGQNAGPHYKKIINSSKAEQYRDWLIKQPLIIETDNYLMTHAGVHPSWDLATIRKMHNIWRDNFSKESFYQIAPKLWSDTPSIWSDDLSMVEQLIFICNVFTRIRYVDVNNMSALNLSIKDSKVVDNNSTPWYIEHNRLHSSFSKKILFGHWSALGGRTNLKNYIALDTGCAWGEYLTAYCLESGEKYRVKACD